MWPAPPEPNGHDQKASLDSASNQPTHVDLAKGQGDFGTTGNAKTALLAPFASSRFRAIKTYHLYLGRIRESVHTWKTLPGAGKSL
jgi:hypothetical protein